MNAPFYEWFSEITNSFIGMICRKCAVRELFGIKYKQNPRYERWIEKEKQRK